MAATTRDTAMTCAAATTTAAGEANVRVVAQASYFAMQAARADPQGKPFFDRFQELIGQIGIYAGPLRQSGAIEGRAAAIVSECDLAYPLARAVNPPQLPQDPFERDLMCLGATSFVEGLGRETVPGGAPAHDEMVAAQQAFIARVPDSRAREAGLPDQQAMMLRVGELLGRSIDLGNSEAVSRSCLALLDG
ncbi:MAG: hypothetical protein ACT4OE_10520 [Sphingosinicella sp.]